MGVTQGWWLVLMAWARLADDGGSLERENSGGGGEFCPAESGGE